MVINNCSSKLFKAMIIHKSDERENCILVALSKDKGELSPFWVVLHKQDSILLHTISDWNA